MLENWIPGSCKGQQCRQLPALRGEVSDILLKDEKNPLFSPALSTISRGYGLGRTWENIKLQNCSEKKAKTIFWRKDGSAIEMGNKESAFSLH